MFSDNNGIIGNNNKKKSRNDPMFGNQLIQVKEEITRKKFKYLELKDHDNNISKDVGCR